MKTNTLLLTIAGIIVMGLAGCGGGGGGTPANAPPVVSGIASKGPVNGGVVSVYPIANGAVDRATSLGTGQTGADGSYSITLTAAPTGPVLVEVIGGQFKDETTASSTNKLFPLRAVADKVAAGNNNIAVTGLTEIAVQKIEGAGGTFSVANILEANNAVELFFGIDDIITTNPADVNVAASQVAPTTAKAYGLALATLMKYAKDNGKSFDPASDSNVFKEFGKLLNAKLDPTSQVNNDTLTLAAIAKYNEARNGFLVLPQNLSGETGITSFTSAVIKVSTEGTLSAGARINGVELTLSLPDGVTIPADVNGIVDTTSATAPVQVTGVAKTAGVTFLAGGVKFTPKTATAPNLLRLVLVSASATSFDLGEFVTITANIAPNSRVLSSAFIITGTKAVTVGTDTSSIGAKIPGVTMVPVISFK
jgi:hypothetical protein